MIEDETAGAESWSEFFLYRNFAVAVAVAIFAVAWLASAVPDTAVNCMILRCTGCYDAVGPEEPDNIVWKDFTHAKCTRVLIFASEVLANTACLVVGGRLIVISPSLDAVIMNAVAAVFVTDLDDLFSKVRGFPSSELCGGSSTSHICRIVARLRSAGSGHELHDPEGHAIWPNTPAVGWISSPGRL